MNVKKNALVLLGAFVTSNAFAQEPVVTLHSTVSGSQEQPRVMYIVPWQEPGAARFDYEMNNQLAEEVFAPIDRDEFVRGINYRQALGEASDAAGSAGNQN